MSVDCHSRRGLASAQIMFWTAILLVLVTLLLLKLYKLVTYWNYKGIPHEPFLKALYRNLWRNSVENPYDVYDEAVQKYGRIFGSYRGFSVALVTTELEIVKEVFIKQFANFYRRSFDHEVGDKLWDNTVGSLPYEHWKSVRSLLGYCFTASKLKGMIPKFDSMAKRCVSQLEDIANTEKNEITLNRFIKAHALDSVVAAAFGIDLESDKNPDSPFIKNASDIFAPGFGMYLFTFAPTLLKYCPFAGFPPKRTSDFFNKFGKRVLDEKRANLDQVIENGTADIMDNFLIAQREDPRNAITDDVLASQAFLFYLAGVDTILVTLEMTTFFMTVHPEVQDKVVEEIKQVMGDRDQVGYDDVQKMKYLDATIQESLRFYPISYAIDRRCNQDTTVAGIPIKSGMLIEVPLRSLHFDPQLFPEPEKFMPERFLKENSQDAGVQGLLTFGEGPKHCVGRRLALMNMQVLLVNMLRKVKLEACEATPASLKLRKGMNFTNVSEKPLILRVVARHWNSEAESG